MRYKGQIRNEIVYIYNQSEMRYKGQIRNEIIYWDKKTEKKKEKKEKKKKERKIYIYIYITSSTMPHASLGSEHAL